MYLHLDPNEQIPDLEYWKQIPLRFVLLIVKWGKQYSFGANQTPYISAQINWIWKSKSRGWKEADQSKSSIEEDYELFNITKDSKRTDKSCKTRSLQQSKLRRWQS